MVDELAMKLETARRGDAVVVTAHGRIAEAGARQLEQELLKQVEGGRSRIVIDLSDVAFVTSTCLGAFMVAHKRARQQGGGVRLVRPQPLVLQILQVTKLTKLFGVHETIESALQFG